MRMQKQCWCGLAVELMLEIACMVINCVSQLIGQNSKVFADIFAWLSQVGNIWHQSYETYI